jgi:hypothetical protein
MSRYQKGNKTHGLAWGNDRATGIFIQVWEIPKDEDNKKALDLFGPDGDDIVVDSDAMFTKLTISGMIDISKEYNLELTQDELNLL